MGAKLVPSVTPPNDRAHLIEYSWESISRVGSQLDAKRDPLNSNLSQRDQGIGTLLGRGQSCARFCRDSSMKTIFCLIAHMREYKGPSSEDVPYWNGKHAKEGWTDNGGDEFYLNEVFNFLPVVDRGGEIACFGHVEESGIRFKRSLEDEDVVDDVTVFWCANDPAAGHCSVVGWYANARVHVRRKGLAERIPTGPSPFGPKHKKWHKTFSIEAVSANCRLLPVKARPILPRQRPNSSYWSIASKVWYANARPDVEKFVRNLLSGQKGDPPTPTKTNQFDADRRKRAMRKAVIREGSPEFRAMLLQAYAGKCAISGYGIDKVLDACHIDPYLGQHSNTPENGLLLRTDLHRLFDAGLIWIDPKSRKIGVSAELDETPYAEFKGGSLRSVVLGPGPGADNLRRHIERI